MVQNATARFLTGVRRREHITPILLSPNWLPVSYRVEFKILLLVFKALTGLAPSYLSNLQQSHQDACDPQTALYCHIQDQD